MLGLGAVTILLLAFLAFQLARKRKKAAEAAALPAVIEGDEDDEDASPLDLLEESDEERLASSRQRIAELRERAVALANEDVHRLAVVFERWFEEDIKAEREARDKEAA
jgi:flagellar biosynthesis/type III secretory pathway M-ring protein FliF/YscJ